MDPPARPCPPNRTTRRGFLTAALVGSVGLAGCTRMSSPGAPAQQIEPASSSAAQSTTTSSDDTGAGDSIPDTVGLETLASGLSAPLDVVFAPDADRRYVADQEGRIYVHGPGGLRDEPFLDLRDVIDSGREKGLLGLALHPNFADNRRVFVRYSAPSREGTPAEYSHTFVLAEFEATEDGMRAPPASERTVLEIPEPQANHNAGAITFGPDGYLYVAVGDGGAGGDQGRGHVSDWYDPVDGGNGQDVTENLLGSILRIDVDNREDGRAYAIPDDNPLVADDGLDEHYAWGLRNPWRMSFDGSDLYVGDVGQNQYEEIDLVERGGNYGWNVKEATHCFGAGSCPEQTPDDVRGGEPLIDPIIEYPHSGGPVSGNSVIGGAVYRGTALPGLEGTYVFADLNASGRLFVASRPDLEGLWPTQVLPIAEGDANQLDRVLSFGRDPDGEVYVLGTGSNGGGLHRIVAVE